MKVRALHLKQGVITRLQDGESLETANNFFVESFTPNNTLGNDEDIWLDSSQGLIYKKESGAWVLEGTISPSGYNHQQPIADSVWLVNHNLGKFPSVTIFDTSGNHIEACVENISLNQVRISFFRAGLPINKAGSAYLT